MPYEKVTQADLQRVIDAQKSITDKLQEQYAEMERMNERILRTTHARTLEARAIILDKMDTLTDEIEETIYSLYELYMELGNTHEDSIGLLVEQKDNGYIAEGHNIEEVIRWVPLIH